ncbi:hypothetical protein [Tepidibacillus decaturensis]|nr:hypothetical protein [Tepidibacillus decaturensis]
MDLYVIKKSTNEVIVYLKNVDKIEIKQYKNKYSKNKRFKVVVR